MPELSGAQWVPRYPDSGSVSSLSGSFRSKVGNFIAALEEAGASVRIGSTLRPKERAFMMHWSWRIADGTFSALNVKALPGLDIDWVHRNAANEPDLPLSGQKAREMVRDYGLVRQPAYPSKHTSGTAIDMGISWRGTLKIKKPDQTIKEISSVPRDGTNAELVKVGAAYGVIKGPANDPPHWSDNGS